ncbi:MAG: UDP-3-O-(3-hydroxymyristoyl)glucosamine N-acyltransferase [Planctomycetota bacterium]
MREHQSFKLSQLAELSGARITGEDITIQEAAGLDKAVTDRAALSFVRRGTPIEKVEESAALAFIVPEDYPELSRTVLKHENPRYVFALALELLSPPEIPEPGIDERAAIHPTASIAEGCSIAPFVVVEAEAVVGAGTYLGPHVVVGRRAVIGQGCRLDAHAVVYRDCEIGDGAILFAGAVVGCDGFGFEAHKGEIRRLHHIGDAIVGPAAEIGANSCIDRGTTGSTVIGPHVKIDNLVMIAHNCELGAAAMIAAQCGIAGSVKVGKGLVMGGAAKVRDHVEIGDGVTVGGGSGVATDIPAGATVSGMPAHDHREVLRELLALPHLPKLLRDFRQLRRDFEDLRALKQDFEDLRDSLDSGGGS